jgi:mono/diheme cytochrome c family protein
MTAKFLTTIALVAFVLTSWARIYNTDAHGAAASQPVTNAAPTNVHGTDLSETATNTPPANAVTINARTLFLRNCAHCHGADAHGDDGPDLHDLGLADDWIANRIRKGKAGQMTAFAGKLQPAEIAALVAYVQSLK